MAIKIRFDGKNMPTKPTILLATRSGRKLEIIPDTSSMHISDNFNSPTDISFSISKTENNTSVWDEIKNFRKVWIPEYDKWFTLTYDVSESNELVKNISLVPNSEFELSNVNVHELEINTESDILRENYTTPTTFYNPEEPSASLLDRILTFTKGFTIKHVDTTLMNMQRTFSLNGQSVYDTFNTIAEEFQCLFVYDSGTLPDGSIERAISAYDLRSYCNTCGYRGDFNSTCPKCGGTNIELAYGEDTTILVDTDGLASQINLSTNTDAVKNCFRLTSGDGLMDAAIIASNPNGTQYLWHFSDDMKDDMSQELKDKLILYDRDYDYYEDEYVVPLSSGDLTTYNYLVNKYSSKKEDLETITDVIGYAELMNTMYDVMDFKIFLENELLPTLNMETNAEEQAARINLTNLPQVAVQNINVASATTVENAVTTATRIVLDVRYMAKTVTSVYDAQNHAWTGTFKVTANSNKEDTATTESITIPIVDTYETFAKQKIEKAIAQLDKKSYSITGLFELGINDFTDELTKYSRSALDSILTCCQGAIGVMVELGISNPTSAALVEGGVYAYTNIYLPYVQKLRAIESEIALRDDEIAALQNMYDSLYEQKMFINDALDIINYLGDTLATELYSYKMEDDYQNNNYISDGLTNDELFKKAGEFIRVANEEIHKASIEQHTISTTMNNLLTIEEFQPLVEHFSVGNWIRIKVNGVVYRVRLLSYSIDFDNINNLDVELSDVVGTGETSLADIFESARSMSKSYESTKHQAETSIITKEKVDDWIRNGLDLTTMRILNATNQTMILDDTGMAMKQWDDLEQDYLDYQSKWINTTLAFTKDNWETTETALGRFNYYDPSDGEIKEGFGVIAKQLIGNLILGDELGIYSQNGNVTIDENGLTITSNGDDEVNSSVFTIQKKTSDGQGGTNITKQLYLDEDGNLVFNANNIYIGVDQTLGQTLDDLQNQVDGNVETWNGSVVPTLNNYPANQWITTDTKNRHIGDIYYVQSSDEYNGYSYRFALLNGQYQWTLIEDTNVAKALADSAKALAGVEGLQSTAITNDVIYYLATPLDSGVTTSTAGWTTNPSGAVITSVNKYLWTYHLYTYGVGSAATTRETTPIIIGTYGNDGQIGQDGVGVSSITEYYCVSSSGSTIPPDSSFSTTIPSMTEENKYLWNYEKVSYTNGSVVPTGKRVIGVYGNDGRGIDSVVNWYLATNASSGVTTSTSGWTTTIQNMTPTKRYLWNYEEITYTSGNPTVTTPCIIGVFGERGADGASAVVQELQLSSPVIVKNSNGDYSPNSLTLTAKQITGATTSDYNGRFKIETTSGDSWHTAYTSASNQSTYTFNILNNYTMIRCSLYQAGETTILIDQQTVPIVKDGIDGASKTVILTNESHSFAGSYSTAVAGSVTIDVLGYVGAQRFTTQVGTITGQISGKITASVSNNNTDHTSITVSVTNTLDQQSGILTIPVTIDGLTINKIFSWTVVYIGKSIVEDVPIYISSNLTTAPSIPVSEVTRIDNVANVWTRGMPRWTDTYCHLYTCHQIKYSDGSIQWTTVINDVLQEHFYEYDTNVNILVTNSSIQNIVSGKYTNHLDYLDDTLGDTGLNWKVNYSNYTTANDGECYFYGYNQNGVESDTDGWVWWNKEKVTITKGAWINPDNVAPYNIPIYHVYRKNESKHYDVWYDDDARVFKGYSYDSNYNKSAINTFNWVEANDIVLATYMSTENEGAIIGTELFTPPKKASSITKITQSKAQLDIMERSIELSVQETYDNLKIGGRNIVLNTIESAAIVGNGSTNKNADFYYLSDTWVSYEDNIVGGWVTISYDWYTTGGTPSGIAQVGFNAAPRWEGQMSYISDISSGSGHVTNSVQISQDDHVARYSRIRIRLDNVPSNVTFIVKNLKVEFGNKPTSWTPAPEDAYTKGGIQLLVDTNAPSLYRITARADRYWVNESSLSNDGSASIVDIVDAPQNNIRYGVRLTSTTTSQNLHGIGFYSDSYGTVIEAGKTYTLSCYARYTSGSSPTLVFTNQSGSNTNTGTTYECDSLTSNWERYSWTFTAPISSLSNGGIIFGFNIRYDVLTTAELCGFKLEKGYYASEWCLSDSELSIVDNLIAYPYQEHINNNVDGTTVYTQNTSGIVYTYYTDGSIKANGTATQNQTKQIYIDTIPAGTYTLSGCPIGGSVGTYCLGIYDEEAQIYTPYDDTGGGCTFTITESRRISIQIRVWSGTTLNNLYFYPMLETGGIVHAWVSPVGTQSSRIKSAEASIKVNADNIEAKVSSTDFNGNNIISKINLSSTTAVISAPRISLAGKDIDLTGDNITINSNNFSVDKYGNLTARSGNIAGWNITNNAIYKYTNYTEGTASTDAYLKKLWATEGTTDTGWAFSVQKCEYDGSDFDNYTTEFLIQNNGYLYCTSANITGKVTATSGKIGNWVINGNRLENDMTQDGGYRIGMQNSNGVTANYGAVFYAGCTTPAGGSIADEQYTKFYIRQDGYLYCSKAKIAGTVTATSGSVGGWNINSNSIYKLSAVDPDGGDSQTQYRPRLWCSDSPQYNNYAFDVYKRSYNASTDSYGSWSELFHIRYDGHIKALSGGQLGGVYIGVGTSGGIYYGMTSMSDSTNNGFWLGQGGIAFGKSTVYIKSNGTFKFGAIQSVGDTAPYDAWVTHALHVSFGCELYAGNSNSEPYIDFRRDRTSPTLNATYDYTARISNSSTNVIRMQGMRLASGGNAQECTLVVGSVQPPSDRRLKEDIVPLNLYDSEEFVMSLIPSRFKYKSDLDTYHHGFIYDEVERVKYENDWVVSSEIENMYGDGISYGTVSSTEIIPDIVAALQYQIAENKKRYDELNEKYNNIMRMLNS